MNYFVEGLQGSGKSTLVQKLSDMNPGYTAVREGEYSPVELSWCAYVDDDQYHRIVEKYAGLRSQIEEKTYSEGCRKNTVSCICRQRISAGILTSFGKKDRMNREMNCGSP